MQEWTPEEPRDELVRAPEAAATIDVRADGHAGDGLRARNGLSKKGRTQAQLAWPALLTTVVARRKAGNPDQGPMPPCVR